MTDDIEKFVDDHGEAMLVEVAFWLGWHGPEPQSCRLAAEEFDLPVSSVLNLSMALHDLHREEDRRY